MTTYFKTTKGETFEVLKEFTHRYEKATEAIVAFAKEEGADVILTRFHCVFKGSPPKGWKKDGDSYEGQPTCKVDKRTKEGKAIWKRINDLPRQPTSLELWTMLGLKSIGPRIPLPQGYLKEGVGYLLIDTRLKFKPTEDDTEITAGEFTRAFEG